MKSRTKTFAVIGSLLVCWFIPWVFVLRLGLLVYLPYHADGKSRYFRIMGPNAELFSKKDEWLDSSEISPLCLTVIPMFENPEFYRVPGVSMELMLFALRYNYHKGAYILGASTITQQIVKNGFLYRDKTLLRKSREIVGAIILDRVLSKKDQLTWYLNMIEFGPDLYGIKSASQYYFSKEAINLNLGECLLLSSILPSPTKWSKLILTMPNSPKLISQQRALLRAAIRSQQFGKRDLNRARLFIEELGSKRKKPQLP